MLMGESEKGAGGGNEIEREPGVADPANNGEGSTAASGWIAYGHRHRPLRQRCRCPGGWQADQTVATEGQRGVQSACRQQ